MEIIGTFALIWQHGCSPLSKFIDNRAAPCLVVLDLEYRIVSSEPRLNKVLADAGLRAERPDRLPAAVEAAVWRLIARGEYASVLEPAAGDRRVLIRTAKLEGPGGGCIAVTIEPLRTRDPLCAAAQRYNLTKRELEVLSFILQGLEARQIAERMEIAQSTVGEYFKRLHAKFGVRNRSAMLARVFGWPDAPL